MQCIHGLWSPALAASMAPLGAAMQMGSKERAVYLGHKVLRGVKVRSPLSAQNLSVACISIYYCGGLCVTTDACLARVLVQGHEGFGRMVWHMAGRPAQHTHYTLL